MDAMLRVALPMFVSVTVCAGLVVPVVWLANVKLDGDMLAIGAVGAVPVPVKGIACGLPEALSVNVIAPVRVPVAVGLKVTLTVQETVAASVAPHEVADLAKSPVARIDAMFNVALPSFFNVMVWTGLVVPTV